MLYIESADVRLIAPKSLDYQTVSVAEIKANASAAKSDLTEALNILSKIPLDDLNNQDRADLKALIILVKFEIDFCDLLKGPFSDILENSKIYSETKDPSSAANSMNSIKKSLGDMDSSLDRMNRQMSSINESGLSPKFRADFIYYKSLALSLQDTIQKQKNTLENACTIKCPLGEVTGDDCSCHASCGSSYCSSDTRCCDGKCYTPCPVGMVRGDDCSCYEECGRGYYCSPDAYCCSERCYTACLSGQYRGADCQCYQLFTQTQVRATYAIYTQKSLPTTTPVYYPQFTTSPPAVVVIKQVDPI
jgi:hypothetical protein